MSSLIGTWPSNCECIKDLFDFSKHYFSPHLNSSKWVCFLGIEVNWYQLPPDFQPFSSEYNSSHYPFRVSTTLSRKEIPLFLQDYFLFSFVGLILKCLSASWNLSSNFSFPFFLDPFSSALKQASFSCASAGLWTYLPYSVLPHFFVCTIASAWQCSSLPMPP